MMLFMNERPLGIIHGRLNDSFNLISFGDSAILDLDKLD